MGNGPTGGRTASGAVSRALPRARTARAMDRQQNRGGSIRSRAARARLSRGYAASIARRG